MMQNATVRNGYDLEGMRRVAKVLLRHVRPQNRSDAFMLLDEKLGGFMCDRTAFSAEIDRYFGNDIHLAA